MSIMLKRCILPSIALILANLLTAWAKDSPGSSSALPSGAEALIYENKALDLCLTLPAGWREVKLMDKAKHACMFTRGEDIFFYVTPAPTNRTWSAQAVLNETISRLLQANTDLREVPPREVYPLEHGAAIVAMFQRPRTGRATLIVWVAGVSIHARGFGVVCTAPPDMLTTLKPEWIAMLESMRILSINGVCKGDELHLPTLASSKPIKLTVGKRTNASSFAYPIVNAPHPITCKGLQPALLRRSAYAEHISSALLSPLLPAVPIPVTPTIKRVGALTAIPVQDAPNVYDIPALRMRIWLPEGWRIMPLPVARPLTANVGSNLQPMATPGFQLVRKASLSAKKTNAPSATLSVNFVPTIVGVTSNVNPLQAAQRLVEMVALMERWQRFGDWEQLRCIQGEGVAALFTLAENVSDRKACAWIAAVLLQRHGLIAVGLCPDSERKEVIPIYRKVMQSIMFY